MNEMADPVSLPKAGTYERTFVLGYVAGVTLAWVTANVGGMAWSGEVISRYDLDYWLFFAVFGALVFWITAAIPFAVVRRMAGVRAFSSPWRAAASGAAVGVLMMPFAVEMGRILNIEGPTQPFLTDLFAGAVPKWPLFVGPGAAGGLTYWLIEFSSAPAAVARLFGNVKPLRWTCGLFSRRRAAAMAAALALAAAVPVGQWWWRPHVHQPPGVGVPPVAFEDEWRTQKGTMFLTWSADGTGLISLSQDGRLAVRNRRSGTDQERKLPQTMVTRAVGNQQLIVVPADRDRSRIAFSVFDAQTGEILHEEPDPAPEARGSVGFEVKLALSPDGTTLAVGYNFTRASVPVSLLSTQDWRKVSTIGLLSNRQSGASFIVFSQNGKRLAVGYNRELVVCDAGTGALLSRMPIWSYTASFSPDGSMLAVVAERSQSGTVQPIIRVVRLSDGAEVASHEPGAGSGYGASLLWDSRGRFVVSSVEGANTVHLWNPSTSASGDVTLDLRRFTGGLAFSPDGSRLAVSNGDAVSIFRVGE
ncbi:MAG: WD40 repeat domain-containing protein [Janthinobacterium lividum]